MWPGAKVLHGLSSNHWKYSGGYGGFVGVGEDPHPHPPFPPPKHTHARTHNRSRFQPCQWLWPTTSASPKWQQIEIGIHKQVLFFPVWHKPRRPQATQSTLWAGLAVCSQQKPLSWLVGFVRDFSLNICQWLLSGVARFAGERFSWIGWTTLFSNQSTCCAWGRGTQHDRTISSTGRHIPDTNKASGKMEL